MNPTAAAEISYERLILFLEIKGKIINFAIDKILLTTQQKTENNIN